MKKIYSLLLVSALFATGCNNDFLEVYPQDQQTESTAFITDSNFKTYAWSLYEIFEGYSDTNFSDEINAGNFITKGNSAASCLSLWAQANIIVPASPEGTGKEGNGVYYQDWDFSYIRQVNLMLDNIDKSKMSEEEKKHWRSVGYFFRAYRYLELVSRYGDVPWIDHVLTTDSEELYSARTKRDSVTNQILLDLQYAAKNIRKDGDGSNTINKNVVNALLSRFGLFEGTWRKYHSLGNSEKYLQACVDASKEVLTSVPNVHSNYDALFNSLGTDLAKISEVLLYKDYRNMKNEGHSRVRSLRTGEATTEATKYFVDKFLCTDGKPISTSEKYEGNKESNGSKKVYAEFRNRDRRLYLTIIPPYMTNNNRSGNITSYIRYQEGDDNYYADEYINLINSNNGTGWAGNKVLPASNFKGYYATRIPNLWQSANGVWNWQKAYMGYIPWKFYNTWVECPSNDSSNNSAAPIFRTAEVMLNYAEAACELNIFTQDVADATINKLRERAGVQKMVVSNITADWDTNRDSDVNPVLWEVRREREVELSCEGFAFRDVRRWKKAEKVLSQMPLGAWVNKADYGNPAAMKVAKINADGSLDLSESNQEGYVYIFNMNGVKGWQSHYYLYPLPLSDLALNTNLKQNDGYNK